MGVSKGPGTGAAYQTTLKALPHSPSIYGSARAFLSFAHNVDQLGEIDSCLMCSVQHILETRVPESRLIGYWTQDFIYQLGTLATLAPFYVIAKCLVKRVDVAFRVTAALRRPT